MDVKPGTASEIVRWLRSTLIVPSTFNNFAKRLSLMSFICSILVRVGGIDGQLNALMS